MYEGKVSVTPIELSLANKEAVAYLEDSLKPLLKQSL